MRDTVVLNWLLEPSIGEHMYSTNSNKLGLEGFESVMMKLQYCRWESGSYSYPARPH
jgi:hypothetical protein